MASVMMPLESGRYFPADSVASNISSVHDAFNFLISKVLHFEGCILASGSDDDIASKE